MSKTPYVDFPYGNELEAGGEVYYRALNSLINITCTWSKVPMARPHTKKVHDVNKHVIVLVALDGTKMHGTCVGGGAPIEIQLIKGSEDANDLSVPDNGVVVYEARPGLYDIVDSMSNRTRFIRYVRTSLGMTPDPPVPEVSEDASEDSPEDLSEDLSEDSPKLQYGYLNASTIYSRED